MASSTATVTFPRGIYVVSVCVCAVTCFTEFACVGRCCCVQVVASIASVEEKGDESGLQRSVTEDSTVERPDGLRRCCGRVPDTDKTVQMNGDVII
ncbi:hypothetical protein EX30DRAFT_342300 [Ascodesmis nigricans]|uniref:Uncharacterized protein n=1 Tax=Ascodesmis nigricans TaxID=341454 RepID=A0A4S2MT84_9PEZI|nr:hypothetical protein EX30DRAFT_342300 [Ascodesmis nigricans]